MQVFRLKISQFRNLADLDLEFSPQFNFIYGPNGSGKSSLLEAIHFLSLGRSFRSVLASRAIHYEAEKFNLFSTVLEEKFTTTLGLEKTRQGKTKIKIGKNTESISVMAKLLPIQLVNPNSYHLLSGGPKMRRQFIDWGVFHSETHFFRRWQQFQQTLKQRNAGLQMQMTADQLKIWNCKLVELAVEITQMRKTYLQQLIPLIIELMAELADLNALEITFYQGWDTQLSLEEVLHRAFFRDLTLGYTQYGPQRADLLIKAYGNSPVHEVLSRGEQKLLAYALQLAQGLLLKKLTNKSCIYLFDDLFAELDTVKQGYLLFLLKKLQSQVFVTVIDGDVINSLNHTLTGKKFQVMNGKILEKTFS